MIDVKGRKIETSKTYQNIIILCSVKTDSCFPKRNDSPNKMAKLLYFLPLIIYLFSAVPVAADRHPLDPLSPPEFKLIRSLIINSNPSTNFTFQYVALADPTKQSVLSWLSNPKTPPPPRRAIATVRFNKATHEILIDLHKKTVISNRVYSGPGYAPYTFEEQFAAAALPPSHPPFVAAMKKRGLKMEEVVCACFSVGWFGEKRKVEKRIAKVQCYYLDGSGNLYMRPVEGVTVTVDLDEMKILGFRDRYVVPIPKVDGTEYRESKLNPPFLPPLNGIKMLQPDGPSFKVNAHSIRYTTFSHFLFLIVFSDDWLSFVLNY